MLKIQNLKADKTMKNDHTSIILVQNTEDIGKKLLSKFGANRAIG